MSDENYVPKFVDCSSVCVPNYFNLHIPVNANGTIIKNAYRHYSRILHPDKYPRLYERYPPPNPPRYLSTILPLSWLPYLPVHPKIMTDLQKEHWRHALDLIQRAYSELYPIGGQAHLAYWLHCGITQIHGDLYKTKRDKVIHGMGRKPWFWEYEVGLGGVGEQFVNFGHFLLDNGEWKLSGTKSFTDWMWEVCERWREARGYGPRNGEWLAFKEGQLWPGTGVYGGFGENCNGKVWWVWIPGGEFLSGWETIDEDYHEHWVREARRYTGKLPLGPMVNSFEPKLGGIGISTNTNTNKNISWSERRSETDLRLLIAGDAEWEAAIGMHVKQTGVLLLIAIGGLFLIWVLWRVLRLIQRMVGHLVIKRRVKLQQVEMTEKHITVSISENAVSVDTVRVKPKDGVHVMKSPSEASELNRRQNALWALKDNFDGNSDSGCSDEALKAD